VDNLEKDQAWPELVRDKLAVGTREQNIPVAAKPSLETCQACLSREHIRASFSAEPATAAVSFAAPFLPLIFQPEILNKKAGREDTWPRLLR
jgi:hypothetical protein